jgi:hypothetical protein
MKSNLILVVAMILTMFSIQSCRQQTTSFSEEMKRNTEKFEEVTLYADLSWLSENEREIIRLLIRASDIMDDIFWMQSYGDKESLMAKIDDDYTRQYAKIHYGPWDRLNGNAPFYPGYDDKPLGANFYPLDMTREEFDAWDEPTKNSLYTLIRRDENGNLVAIPYSEAYRQQHEEVARLMRQAADLAEDAGLRNYLLSRADALLSNEYQQSDYAWMAMKTANIDFVVGPIENYEDRLFGHKAAHEAFVLVKDLDWSAQLEKFTGMLPALQAGLPVPNRYKAETPGTDSDMNVYYAIYYAGDCNAGSKTIAINLPNDPEIHNTVGSRKLQLKNSMKAKFDKILVPITDILIHQSQRQHITFDAFFENVTFHEVAHGMGIKNTINDKGTVRDALQEYYAPVEEAKADIMGLYLVTRLYEMGEITSGNLMDNYVTFFGGIFRSSRFGASSAHGRANMLTLKYFANKDAFIFENGTYKVNFEQMKEAVVSLMERILILQGDGDYEGAKAWFDADGIMTEQLREDLARVNATGIPVDITFTKGLDVLGL